MTVSVFTHRDEDPLSRLNGFEFSTIVVRYDSTNSFPDQGAR